MRPHATILPGGSVDPAALADPRRPLAEPFKAKTSGAA
jgi:hypothetical protein